MEAVNSIADLKNLVGNSTSIIQLLGYDEPGDGGGGLFYWDENSTEDDNAGTIIEPNLVITSGRWKRNFSTDIQVQWYGVTTENSAVKNSINIKKIPPLLSINFSPGTYKFSEPISFNGNDFIGSNKGTVLLFENSDGIVLDRNFFDEFGANNYLQYISKREFKNLKIDAFGYPFYLLKSDTTFESFSYCVFDNLHLRSDKSLFFSDIVPTNNNYFCYTNSFTNIIAETQDSIFENCSLAVVTSMDNIHDQSSRILFKNCLLDVECANFNFGFAYNFKHIIFNELIESNFQRAKFTGCNFEQIRSNPIINLNVNSVFDIEFNNSFNHFGYESLNTQLEGAPVFVYDSEYVNIENAFIAKNYTLSDDFYPFIGFNIYVTYLRSRLGILDEVPNKGDIMMSVQVNTETAGNLAKKSNIDGYFYKYSYISKEVVRFKNIDSSVFLDKITDDDYQPFIRQVGNLSFEFIKTDNIINTPKSVTVHTDGVNIFGGFLEFNLSSNTTISKDDINRKLEGFAYLVNKSDNNLNVYFNDDYIVNLIKNQYYLFNGQANICYNVNTLSMRKIGSFAQKPLIVESGFQYYCLDKTSPASPLTTGCLIIKHTSGIWIDVFGNVIA